MNALGSKDVELEKWLGEHNLTCDEIMQEVRPVLLLWCKYECLNLPYFISKKFCDKFFYHISRLVKFTEIYHILPKVR